MSSVRIHERGYRRYDGPRRGVAGAIRSTTVHTLRFILGLRRRARSKVIPWGIAVLAYLPAIVFVAALLLVPDQMRGLVDEALPGPELYLGLTTLLVYLAAAVAGPAALCGDRRSGALALYLASPLNRDTYLLAKAGAVVVFLSLVTVVPPLMYVVGSVLAGSGPDGPAAVALAVGRVLATGTAWALLFGSLSLAAASLTSQQIAATAGVVLYTMLSGAVVGTTVFGLDGPEVLVLLDVNQVAIRSVVVIWGDATESGPSGAAVLGALAAWTVGFGALARWRYQRLAVTR